MQKLLSQNLSLLLLSALVRGSELRIYSHKVCMYVRGGSRSGMSRGTSLHTIERGRSYAGMCASRSLAYSDTTQILIADDSVL